MLIDWFTVGAQIFNFLVLLVLLKVFLYDRVIKAMDRREKSIQERIDEGRERMAEARKLREEYEAKTRDLDRLREETLAQAKDEARDKREQILSEAKDEAAQLAERWKEGVRRERETFLAEMSRAAVTQVLDLTRKVLADLADEKLEDHVARRFLDQLDQMDAGGREDLARAMQGSDGPVLVKSALELDEELRRRITRELHETAEVEVEFRIAPDLVLGLLVVAGGRTFGFNVEDYLEDLREAMDEALMQGAVQSGDSGGGQDHE